MLSTALNRRTIDFDVHGAGVSVTADDERALSAIEDFLRPFVTDAPVTAPLVFDVSTSLKPLPPDPNAQQVCDLDYFSMTKAGSKRFLCATGVGHGEADLDTQSARIWTDGWEPGHVWGMTRLIFLPLWAMLLKTTGRFTIHAAAVASGGRALLFPSFSGGGKSTLTMNLVSAGFELMSDDTQFLIPTESGIKIAAFTEKIALRRGALEFFPHLKELPVSGGDRRCVDPWEYGLPVVQHPVDPGIIAFPTITGKPETTYRHISTAEALQRLILCSFFFTDQAVLDEHLKVLSSLVAASRCYLLDVGTEAGSLIEAVKRMESEK